jgi:hypothetical protein
MGYQQCQLVKNFRFRNHMSPSSGSDIRQIWSQKH